MEYEFIIKYELNSIQKTILTINRILFMNGLRIVLINKRYNEF